MAFLTTQILKSFFDYMLPWSVPHLAPDRKLLPLNKEVYKKMGYVSPFEIKDIIWVLTKKNDDIKKAIYVVENIISQDTFQRYWRIKLIGGWGKFDVHFYYLDPYNQYAYAIIEDWFPDVGHGRGFPRLNYYVWKVVRKGHTVFDIALDWQIAMPLGYEVFRKYFEKMLPWSAANVVPSGKLIALSESSYKKVGFDRRFLEKDIVFVHVKYKNKIFPAIYAVKRIEEWIQDPTLDIFWDIRLLGGYGPKQVDIKYAEPLGQNPNLTYEYYFKDLYTMKWRTKLNYYARKIVRSGKTIYDYGG